MTRKKRQTGQSMPPRAAQNAALERFKPLLSAEDFQLVLEELSRPLPIAFRTNPLKASPGAEQEWAQRYGWQLEPVPFCPTGFRVIQADRPVAATLEHHMGQYYIQDAASMLPVELFDLDGLDFPLVLDMAASPGGKTTHLSARLHDRGLVIANDSSTERITALRLVLQTWGAANVAVTRFPGEKFGRWYPETFDRVLLDAPCSMQSLRSTEAHPMRSITRREQANLARRQVALLAAAIAALKPGGQVVYSTCTLAPEENEAVLDEILRRYPHQVQIESLSSRLPAPAPALAAVDGVRFNPQVERAARLWPHIFHTSGFFAALIQKTDAIDFPVEHPPDRPLANAGQTRLGADEERVIHSLFRETYGFELEPILVEFRLELWRSPAGIFAIPATYLKHFSGLPCQLLGLKVAEETPAGFIPAHDWVGRFEQRFHESRLTIAEDQVAMWLRGEDLPAEGLHEGVMILFDPDGRCLGRGRVRAGTVKNLLPRRFF